VEGFMPDFLTLLHGVIDSPDIPLNVSRSYLQSDRDVKKISTYVTKKVADRLSAIFKEDRKKYEEKWDDLKIFIHYGMLSQEDFYDRAKDFALLKNVDGKYFTLDEYKTLIKDNQTDKDGNLVYLYATDKDEQYSYIEAARAKGYDILLMDGQLDTPVVSMFEQKLEKCRFVRVDADVADRLVPKEDAPKNELEAGKADRLSEAFRSQLPKLDKADIMVEVQALGEQVQPVMMTQSEYMRRMKDMSRYQQGMSFYAQMPDSYTLVLNSDHPLVKQVLSDEADALDAELQPIESEIRGAQARVDVLRQEQNKKKYDEITQEEKDELHAAEDQLNQQQDNKKAAIARYAAGNKVIHQLIDLALLQNGMLKGAALDAFLKRSVDLIK
jgi:molecular chaperone HtpG